MRTFALRTVWGPIAILLAALALVVGSSAFRAGASDHLDAPTVRADGRIDINDLYVFQGNNSSDTVLVMTVDPAAGILSPKSFRPGATYQFNVSTNSDTIPEVVYRVKFGGVDSSGKQHMSVQRAAGGTIAGNGGMSIGAGSSYQTISLGGGGMAWAGLRDDPFFFDLNAFKHFKATLLAGGGLTDLHGLVDCSRTNPAPTDFFVGFNGMAIVLEVPNSALGGGTVKVWANTLVVENGVLTQVDRIGIPGMNTIFNHTDATKEAYNRANPKNDVANYTGQVAGVVSLISGLAGTVNHDAYGAAVAGLLLPDVLTYRTGSVANFATLNGRGLADDVIDVALSVVANTPLSDCVANDSTFSSSFPYLGAPNPNP
jgi:hypothetical protein